MGCVHEVAGESWQAGEYRGRRRIPAQRNLEVYRYFFFLELNFLGQGIYRLIILIATDSLIHNLTNELIVISLNFHKF